MTVFGKSIAIIKIVDALILLLHITYDMSMVQVWFLDPFHIPYRLDIVILTIIVYIIRFGINFPLLKARGNDVFFLFTILYLFDVIQNLTGAYPRGAVVHAIKFVDMFFFMQYVYSMYMENKLAGKEMACNFRAYEIYVAYNIAVVLICATLFF